MSDRIPLCFIELVECCNSFEMVIQERREAWDRINQMALENPWVSIIVTTLSVIQCLIVHVCVCVCACGCACVCVCVSE